MYLQVISCMFPILCGIGTLFFLKKAGRKLLWTLAFLEMLVTAGLFAAAAALGLGQSCYLFSLSKQLKITLKLDTLGLLFAVLALIVFACALLFSYEYMKHEKKESRYLGFYMIALGVYLFLCCAGNLITFYLFFELLTVTTVPLVLHNEEKKSLLAGLKYMLYSLCGAYAALYGVYFLAKCGKTLEFGQGSMIAPGMWAESSGLLLIIGLVMVLGFSVKAGMFPMHAWLTSAHPVAPAPASAVLSAVIVKAGVLAIIRVIYDVFGKNEVTGQWLLSGTYVQKILLIMSIVTVFMGSMLAYGEPVLKKRLAYSTVSQVSYILFGLFLLNDTSFVGSCLHVLAHGFIKATLFLCAGAIIYKTGKTRVEELRGIGKEMPVIMWCYTIASLGLIGIPPMSGFVSKWYLCMGALDAGQGAIAVIGVIVLLISALLTAGYLLPLTVNGFFPGDTFDYKGLKSREPGMVMILPVAILTVLSVAAGLFPGELVSWFTRIFA